MHIVKLFALILTMKPCDADKDILPTFLLDYEGSMRHVDYDPNPFNRMSSSDFADIIHSALKRSEAIVVFIEDSFSVEDVTSKDHLGSPFYHLRQGLLENRVKYFPNVLEPYRTLNRILQQNVFNVFYLNVGTKLELPEDFKYIHVFFENGANETRVKRLRRHDLIIREVYFAVRQLKPGPVVAFYTGKSNPVVLERSKFIPIQPIPVPTDLDVVVISKGALFRFSGVYAATATRRAMFHQMPMVAEESWTRWKLSTKMAYADFELQFNFNLEDTDWWTLETVSLIEGDEEVGSTVMFASAPWDWSYVCGEPIVLINRRDGSSVTISKYQVQPLRPYSTILRNGSAGNDSMCFGPSVNCGPYFNTHILSGLMVTAICVAVLAYGIAALYNCGTNTKYDDPSGRPLTHEVTG